MTDDELLARFAAVFEDDARFSHRRALTLPIQHLTVVLHEVYAELTGREFPARSRADRLFGKKEELVSDAFLSQLADGLVTLSYPCGFMGGAGTQYWYQLLIGDEVRIVTTDQWEDNIADPTESDFTITAASAEALERATTALTTAVAKKRD